MGDAVEGFDPVNRPAHYNQGGIECIDAMKAMATPEEFLGHLRITAVTYIWRFRDKNGIEDLKKAIWYLNRLVAELEKDATVDKK